MAINEYREMMVAPKNHRSSQGWRIHIVGVQYQTYARFGTVGRMSLHTVGELSTYAVGSFVTI